MKGILQVIVTIELGREIMAYAEKHGLSESGAGRALIVAGLAAEKKKARAIMAS